MLTALAVLTIFGGVASLLGFAFVFFGRVTRKYRVLCAAGFALAGVWSGYVLLMPGSSTEGNVASNIGYYRFPSVEKRSETLIIQRGSFTLTGFSPLSIEFPVPFRDRPQVEVINFRGYDPGAVPLVEDATAHQFSVGLHHMLGRGFPPTVKTREFRWVARGIPLEERPRN